MFFEEVNVSETVLVSPGERITFDDVGLQVMTVREEVVAGVGATDEATEIGAVAVSDGVETGVATAADGAGVTTATSGPSKADVADK
jgi:hypothetical protein